MAIFPNLLTEDIVQVSDKFRITARRTYISKDEAAITMVEIEPDVGEGFIDVTNADSDEWYLDWEYATEGDKTISLRVTTDGLPVTITKIVSCLTAASEKLFSNDQDLAKHETSILKYVPRGKNSFIYVHRLAQNEILEQLYKDGFYAYDGSKITLNEILDIDEFKQWSKFLVFRLIYRDLSNAVDDIYDRKSKSYENDEHNWRNKARIKIDLNKDGVLEDNESIDTYSRKLVRA